jgi:hypothetical protein
MIDCQVLNYLPNTLTMSTIASYHFLVMALSFRLPLATFFLGRGQASFFWVDHFTLQNIKQTCRFSRSDRKE